MSSNTAKAAIVFNGMHCNTLHTQHLQEVLNQLTFEITPLIRMYAGRKTIVHKIALTQNLGYCGCLLIFGGKGLRVSSKVIRHY